MSNASAFMDTVALLLFQNIREGIETGRIADMKTVQTAVEAAIAELSRKRLPEGSTNTNDLIAKLLLEIGSLHEKVARCESQLAEFQSHAEVLKEETSQIAACTEACNLLVEKQQKENAKILAAMEGAKTNIPPSLSCPAPAPSLAETASCYIPSKMAVISFPGGPRTVTIHPPGSSSYQSTIRDEKGDAIITMKVPKPVRREGAFRGPIEDIDWNEIHRVYGCGSETGGARVDPPVPCGPDPCQPSPCPRPSRAPSAIIARQHQLLMSTQTDAFGRVLSPDCLIHAKSPSLPTDVSSSFSSFQDSQSSSVQPDATTPFLTPPSPSVGRGKKRTRPSEEDEGEPLSAESHEGALLVDARTAKEPVTPITVQSEESHPPEGPAKRKKLRTSTSVEALSTRPLSRQPSVLDLARAI